MHMCVFSAAYLLCKAEMMTYCKPIGAFVYRILLDILPCVSLDN